MRVALTNIAKLVLILTLIVLVGCATITAIGVGVVVVGKAILIPLTKIIAKEVVEEWVGGDDEVPIPQVPGEPEVGPPKPSKEINDVSGEHKQHREGSEESWLSGISESLGDCLDGDDAWGSRLLDSHRGGDLWGGTVCLSVGGWYGGSRWVLHRRSDSHVSANDLAHLAILNTLLQKVGAGGNPPRPDD